MPSIWTYRLRVLGHLLAVALCGGAAFAAPPPWSAVAGVVALALLAWAAFVWLRLHRQVTRVASEWQLTVDTVDFPLVTVDDHGRVVRMNRAAMEQTGRGYLENLGRPLGELGDGEPWAAAVRMLAEGAGRNGAGDHRLVTGGTTGDGPPRSWEVALHPVKMDGVRPRMLVLGRDVTDRVQLETELRRREVMSSLGALVGNVAHEARSPLYALRSAVDSLRNRHGEDPSLAPRVDLLATSAEQLQGLMQALLDYGKPIRQELAPAALTDVARRALDDVAPRAAEAGVELDLAVSGEPPPVAMDEERMFHVLRNLVENAVQHTPAGGRVELAVRVDPGVDLGAERGAGHGAAEGNGGGAGRVECRVTDAGPGFDPADLPRVFDPFYSRRAGGTGLGLAIVQRVVEEHGGGVEAGNAPAGGGRVRFWLPAS